MDEGVAYRLEQAIHELRAEMERKVRSLQTDVDDLERKVRTLEGDVRDVEREVRY